MVAGCRCFACACDIWYASGAYVYVFEAQSLRKQTNNNVSIT